MRDPKYYKWLESRAKKFALKYRVDYEDLLQEFLLTIVEGKNKDFAHSFFSTIREEYKRGVTGSHDAIHMFSTEDILKPLGLAHATMGKYEFVEYLCDLQKYLNPTEYKLVCMFLVGFDKGEIFERTKDMSRRDFYAFWERINLGGHQQIKATERKIT